MQVGLDEWVDRAIQHGLGVADTDLRAVVGDLGVGVEHVGADAIAKSPLMRERSSASSFILRSRRRARRIFIALSRFWI